MALLNVDRITKRFGGVPVADELSFRIEEGEVVGIIGPNGAGKTTLFNMITGHIPIDSGKITFLDRNITNLHPFQIARHGISRSFQIVNTFQQLTVFENVRLGVIGSRQVGLNFWSNLSRMSDIDRSTHALLKEFELAEVGNLLPANLPYGYQKRLEIAIGLAYQAKLFMLDEPTAGMNEEETAEIIKLIDQTRKKFGLTICFVEHDLDVVSTFATRVMVLSGGKIIADGEPKAILEHAEVKKVYLGG